MSMKFALHAAVLPTVLLVACTPAPDATTGASEVGDPCASGGCDGGSQGGTGSTPAGPPAPPPKTCGTGTSELCVDGQPCGTRDDCASSVCVGGTCAPATDADGVKNGTETDVDCGGPTAKRCGAGRACATNDDCGLRTCVGATCIVPSSTDAVRNGTESDVDCGGAAQSFDGVDVPAAPKCELTKACLADTDCASSVCADTGRCVEAPSCRPLHGGSTCGTGEVGDFGAKHESCCKTLPVPGLTMMQGGVSKQVYLDKYEVTAGRVRAWITAIEGQYGGVPNIQAWVKARMADDALLASMFPGTWADDLPSVASGQTKAFPYHAGGTVTLDLGLDAQLGPTSYYRGTQPGLASATSGCSMDAGGYGHRTYWADKATSDNFGEVYRPNMKDVLDEKSMNCATPLMFAAFCAWDGGYMPTQAAIIAAYGTKQWPWGDTPAMNDDVAKMGNYNAGTGNFGAVTPRYLFPVVDYATFANDFTPIIAAPGRFPKDAATQVRPTGETWMDLGGNLIEWNFNAGAYYGWTGSSFEGHYYPRLWTTAVYYLDKYGKGGVRCMRLR